MSILLSLTVQNFKNYASLEFEPHAQVNCLAGSNGSGKTTILDAISYLSICKSTFSATDLQNIHNQESYFLVKGNFLELDEKITQVQCSIKAGERKQMRLNQTVYERLGDHLGRFPIVFVQPADQYLLLSAPEERRRYLDIAISQADNLYLRNLSAYNHYLNQRNSALKQFYESRHTDYLLLDSYDQQIVQLSKIIFATRKSYTEKLLPYFELRYCGLVGDHENPKLMYSSELENPNFESMYYQNRSRDLARMRTEFGVHRDDLAFFVKDLSLKKFGSQGQQKSYVLALKLAQYDLNLAISGKKSILLLDDIFDKLDQARSQKLLEMIENKQFGQVFFSDSRPDRSAQMLRSHLSESRLFNIENGKIESVLDTN